MTTTNDIPADDELAAARGRVWDVLIPARAGYLAGISPHYDEVFHDVAQRIQHAGSLGKTDIAALVVWKRLSAQTRWVSALMSLPDTEVRAVTELAVTAVRDTALTRGQAARTGRSILADLPGFRTGDALASAILTAAAPRRMAVYNRRVQHALGTLNLPPHTRTLRPLPPTTRRPPPPQPPTHLRLDRTRHRHRPVLDRPPQQSDTTDTRPGP
ncbi:hypothetical protein [Streptomyces rishiriensis]|uniref:hypothetical protein n=1 Tax=Streptomyces rishiriensis TaxID=68264 RepID=UPI0037D20101